MNLFAIAFKSIRQRSLASGLTALSVALGVMLMVVVLVISGIIERTFSQNSIGYHLLAGPKGSDLQLVLSSVYRIQPPIENLPYLFYKQLQNDPRVVAAVPLAFGDVTEQGHFPIVGTTSEFFKREYAPGRSFSVQPGGKQIGGPFDAVIGSVVARKNGWKVGSQFTIQHGGAQSDHIHDEKFTVVSVFTPTGTANDKTVFLDLEGFYQIDGHGKPIDEAERRLTEFFKSDKDVEILAEVKKQIAAARAAEAEEASHDHSGHHHHATPDVLKEVTSVLLYMRSDFDTINLSNELRKGYKAQAINPIRPMRRLMDSVVGNIRRVLVVLTGLIIVVSGVSIFVSIYNSMADRRREIAVMRALGARRQSVFSIILAESILLCVIGGIIGLILGHGLVYLAAPYVAQQTGLLIDPFSFEPIELVLFPILLLLASMVGFIPAMTAYRTDVADALAS